jgi:hypothetical protein
MNKTWFDTFEKLDALDAAARRWLGTPWRENSAVCGRGGGVSCHNLAAEIYFETRCLTRFDVPRGRVREFLSGAGDAMIAYLDTHLPGRFAKADGEPPLPGDLIVLREGRMAKHVGVVLERGDFVHVLRPFGCLISRLDDTTYQPIAALRRPLP